MNLKKTRHQALSGMLLAIHTLLLMIYYNVPREYGIVNIVIFCGACAVWMSLDE